MDRPLDDLIKENQKQFREKKNKSNNNFRSKVKNQHESRESRIQEPYRQNKPNVNKTGNSTQRQIVRAPQIVVQDPPQMKFTVKNNGNNRVMDVQTNVFQNQVQQNQNQFQQASVSQLSGSIFQRIGTNEPQASGTSVTISNLNKDVTLADLSELCGTSGEILSATFALSVNSNEKKKAIVIFARRSEGLLFIQKFNGLTLDGIPMEIKLTGENGKENPFDPFNVKNNEIDNNVYQNNNKKNNKKSNKEKLFGTALNADDEDDEDENQLNSGFLGNNNPSFSITMNNSVQPEFQPKPRFNNNNNNNNFKKGFGIEGPKPDRGFKVVGHNNKNKNNNNNNNNRSRSGSDLDKAFDNYMTSR